MAKCIIDITRCTESAKVHRFYSWQKLISSKNLDGLLQIQSDKRMVPAQSQIASFFLKSKNSIRFFCGPFLFAIYNIVSTYMNFIWSLVLFIYIFWLNQDDKSLYNASSIPVWFCEERYFTCLVKPVKWQIEEML